MVKSSIWLFGGRASDGGGDRATEILGGLGELPFVAGNDGLMMVYIAIKTCY